MRAGAGGRARSPVARAGVAAQPAAVVEGGAGAHGQAALGLLLDLMGDSILVLQNKSGVSETTFLIVQRKRDACKVTKVAGYIR